METTVHPWDRSSFRLNFVPPTGAEGELAKKWEGPSNSIAILKRGKAASTAASPAARCSVAREG